MPSNMLAGSGPVASGGGSGAPSPAMSVQGTVGAAPQAAPNVSQAPNMLAGAPTPQGGLPRPGMAPPPPAPPSIEMLHDVYHKQAYTVSALKGLLSKPDLKTKDVLNEVGDAVADGIIGPFDAATQLKSMPPGDDPVALRQWIGQHYSNSVQALQTVSQMIAAHGQMTRARMGMPQPGMQG